MSRIKRYVGLILVTVIFFSQVLHVSATIEDEKESLNELSSQAEEIQSDIHEAESSKTEIEYEIQSLDEKLTKVATKLHDIQDDMSKTKTKIKKLKKKLKKQETSIEEQYEAMKIRIKYMYENGDTQLISLLFESKNMAEFLNKAEYILELSQYDRKMLEKMQDTKESIEESKEKLEKQYASMEELETKQVAKQDELNALVEEKQNQVSAFNTKITEGEDDLAQLQLEIQAEEELIAEMERLEAEAESRRLAEEASKKAAATQTTTAADNDETTKTTTQKTSSSGWTWPVPGYYYLSSDYGYRSDPFGTGTTAYHSGIDIPAPSGTTIVAAADGEVAWSNYSATAGNWIGIYHGDGVYTVYMHCSYSQVSVGMQVYAGQAIAGVGTTGSSTGNHLHFAVRKDGVYVNPHSYLE